MNKQQVDNKISKIIEIPCASDCRGNLAFIEYEKHLPFTPKRSFWIFDIPTDKTRGGHVNKNSDQVVFAVSGGFTMETDNGEVKSEFKMDSPTKGVLIPAGVWCCLKDFEEGTVCLAFASENYNKEDYINSYNEFLDYLK